MATNARGPASDRRGRVYTPAVGRRLRPWLWVVLIGFALLGANGVYLATVSAVTWMTGVLQHTPFYQAMVALHLALGLAIILPFLGFGFVHLVTSWKRPNKSAIRYGLVLLGAAMGVLATGLLLLRIEGFIDVRDPSVRRVGYWLHVALPVAVIGLYVKHRLAGPMIRWHWARRVGGLVVAGVAVMAFFPRPGTAEIRGEGPARGGGLFLPVGGGDVEREVHPGVGPDGG